MDDINRIVDPEREDEIAQKIASLRRSREDAALASAPKAESPSPTDTEPPPADSEKEDDGPLSLEAQMDEAEAFFGVQRAPANGDVHVPKVQTWGVFPRPENISRAYGGGRKIGIGGEVEGEDERAARAAKTKALLSKYRAGMGIDMEREERHREEVERALECGRREMKRGRAYAAVEALEAVKGFVSPNSALGGELWINVGLAYEAVGRAEDARRVYSKCRKSPIAEVAARAKELLYGFAAMEKMGVSAPAASGLRVAQFDLGDVAGRYDRRYDTTFMEAKKPRPAPAAASAQAQATAAIVALTLLFLALRLHN